MKLYALFIMSLLSLTLNVCAVEGNRNIMETTEFSFVVKSRPDGELSLFAAHDIAQGAQLFHGSFKMRVMKIAHVPDAFKNFMLPLDDEECVVPERFDRLEAGWYMNI